MIINKFIKEKSFNLKRNCKKKLISTQKKLFYVKKQDEIVIAAYILIFSAYLEGLLVLLIGNLLCFYLIVLKN